MASDETIQAKKAAMLAAVAKVFSITRAAEAAQIGRPTHYDWVRDDPEYAAAFEEARRTGAHFLEDEATRRATEGIQKGVFHNGKLVAKQREFSDTLLIFLLKGAMPERYRENVSLNHSGKLAVESTLAESIIASRKKRGAEE